LSGATPRGDDVGGDDEDAEIADDDDGANSDVDDGVLLGDDIADDANLLPSVFFPCFLLVPGAWKTSGARVDVVLCVTSRPWPWSPFLSTAASFR
jgi:hypothetical protein